MYGSHLVEMVYCLHEKLFCVNPYPDKYLKQFLAIRDAQSGSS